MTAVTQRPQPIECLNENGSSPIVLLCEHASRYIPAEYAGLGLDEADLSRHIAWDIGAAELTRSLSKRLDAPAFLGTHSRLLIDLNRPPGAPSSIAERSEATAIPGNLALGLVERERRARQFFTPYHERIAAHVQQRKSAGRPCSIVAIHSFTPVFHGQTRPWHAGVLFDKSADLGHALISALRADGRLMVDANVPYGVSPEEDYGLLVHGDYRGNPAVLIEIRQDLIVTATGIEEWVERLGTALNDCL